MKKSSVGFLLLLAFALSLFAGCGGDTESTTLLSDKNVNLIFVVSPDLANDPLGDVNPATANLNNQGLQRALMLASYLKQQLLGTNNVTGIHALAPMTHLQTANQFPDMAAIGFIQQFALLNKITIQGTTDNSYPLSVGYAEGDVPAGVAVPAPYVPGAQGLAFNDTHENNIKLATGIINGKTPGFHVFSAPWETTSALLTAINTTMGYHLRLPTSFQGSNHVYALTVTPSGEARLLTFDSKLTPPDTYPVLPFSLASASCTQQNFFSYSRTNGVNGVSVPAGTNTNQTVYLIRHAEAHPSSTFEDGNFVAAGQWRALALANVLPNALRGQSSPTMVYSIDPAQSFTYAGLSVSYVRPSLTVLPYAIANNLPFNLVSSFNIGLATDPGVAKATSDFFFTGGALSNQTVLVAWEHEHFPPLLTYLLQTYYGGNYPDPALSWPHGDYDTIWTIKLDGSGNLTVDNALCEGIASIPLPKTAPEF
ncbi:MAG: hypothetical protein EG822_14765 [Deltaproteobacteria bacterium]|nr:hypothetical protein [Deltaproteobacteria bacterium]TLN02088.1 MAG: hypothetical protein FDZ73_13355 [bacterium]